MTIKTNNARVDLVSPLAASEVGEVEYDFFRERLKELTGIRINDQKGALVQARLKQRLVALGLSDFVAYRKYLEKAPPGHPEWESFVNSLTTNKTDWFREMSHFEYLKSRFLPRWIGAKRQKLRVWCAASSTGEEPYSLALLLYHCLPRDFDFEITASDIDTQVLKYAENGVYRVEYLSQIPVAYQANAILRGTAGIEKWFRLRNEIRSKVRFVRHNLLSVPSFAEPFDVIFCRNVLIYFDGKTVLEVIKNLYHAGATDSLLFLGHTEATNADEIGYRYLTSSIYVKGTRFDVK